MGVELYSVRQSTQGHVATVGLGHDEFKAHPQTLGFGEGVSNVAVDLQDFVETPSIQFPLRTDAQGLHLHSEGRDVLDRAVLPCQLEDLQMPSFKAHKQILTIRARTQRIRDPGSGNALKELIAPTAHFEDQDCESKVNAEVDVGPISAHAHIIASEGVG